MAAPCGTQADEQRGQGRLPTDLRAGGRGAEGRAGAAAAAAAHAAALLGVAGDGAKRAVRKQVGHAGQRCKLPAVGQAAGIEQRKCLCRATARAHRLGVHPSGGPAAAAGPVLQPQRLHLRQLRAGCIGWLVQAPVRRQHAMHRHGSAGNRGMHARRVPG